MKPNAAEARARAFQPMTISSSEYNRYGCPFCGHMFCYRNMSGGGAALVTCSSCRFGYVVLADELEESPIRFGGGDKEEPRPPERRHAHPLAILAALIADGPRPPKWWVDDRRRTAAKMEAAGLLDGWWMATEDGRAWAAPAWRAQSSEGHRDAG